MLFKFSLSTLPSAALSLTKQQQSSGLSPHYSWFNLLTYFLNHSLNNKVRYTLRSLRIRNDNKKRQFYNTVKVIRRNIRSLGHMLSATRSECSRKNLLLIFVTLSLAPTKNAPENPEMLWKRTSTR